MCPLKQRRKVKCDSEVVWLDDQVNTGATERSQKVRWLQLAWGEYDEVVVTKLRFSVILVETFLQEVEDTELISGNSCMLERRVGCHPEMKLK